MTVTDLHPTAEPSSSKATSAATSSARFITRPGLIERFAVVLTTFILLHGIPNTWFVTRADVLESDGGNPLLVVIELGLIGLALLRVAGSYELVYQALRLEPAIMALVGLALASTFWSANLYLTAKDSFVLTAVTLYGAYLIIRFALNEILRMLALMFMASAVLNASFIILFAQYAKDNGAGAWDGVFSQKNALGFAATIAIPTLVTVAREHRRYRLASYAAAIVHFVLLLGSESKTMLVATLMTLVLMVIYRGFRARRTLRGAVILGLFSTTSILAAFATANIAFIGEVLDKDVTLTGRTLLWEDLIPIFLERPLLGYGLGAAFDGYFSPVHEVWIQNRWAPTHAHNALLQTGLELGLLGIALTLFIFVRATSRAIRTVRDVPGSVGIWPLAFCSTALLISVSESGVMSNNIAWLLYIVAVMSTAAQQRSVKSIHTASRDRTRVE